METKTINGALGVNKEQLIALLGSTMYRNNACEVAVKELVQNAFDAVKIAKSINPSHKSQIKVDLNSTQRVITVSDNGIGMSSDIVLKAFFTIGGSYKGDNVDNRLKSGGLGLAKMAFLFSSDWVEVTTVKDGKKTYVKATSDQIRKDDFHLEVSNTDEANGTTVSVKIPTTYVDNDGETRSIYFTCYPNFLDKPMLGDVDVIINGTKHDKRSLPSKYLYIGRATSDFGDLDLYISPSSGSSVNYNVLISGLYQFRDYCYCDGQRKGLDVVVNIFPSVGVKSEVYPINNQREGFRATVRSEVQDLENLFKEIQLAYSRGQYAASFNSSLSMEVRELSSERRIPYEGEILKQAIAEVTSDVTKTEVSDFVPFLLKFAELHEARKEKERKSSLNTSGINKPKTCVVDISGLDINKPVFHNNTDLVLNEEAMAFLKEFGALLLEFKSLYMQTYPNVKRERKWESDVCIADRMKDQFWGISFDKNYLGVNVSPTLFNFLAVNPFGFALPSYKGVDQAWFITSCLIHCLVHEINHNAIEGEGDEFTSHLVITEAECEAIGDSFESWKEDLYDLVKENLQLINDYNALYRVCSNKSESLK